MSRKPLYMPNDEDIFKLNKIKLNNDINHIDIYGYIVAKTIEKLINDNKFLKNVDSYILDIPEIVHGVCWVYPQEALGFEKTKQDGDLCYRLLTKGKEPSIHNLDYLSMFDESVQQERKIVELVIQEIDDKQLANPEYRFTYRQNSLLDAIYSVDYQKFLNQTYATLMHLINIDPMYSLKFDHERLIPEFKYIDNDVIAWRISCYFATGFAKYRQLYDLRENYNYDDIDYSNPSDEKVRRLLNNLYK